MGWGGVGRVSSEECSNNEHALHALKHHPHNQLYPLSSSQLENLLSPAILGVLHVKDLQPIGTPTPAHTYTNGYSHPSPHTPRHSYLAETTSVETQQYTDVYKQALTHTHAHTHTHTHTHSHSHPLSPAHPHNHTNTLHTHSHPHTHPHTHTITPTHLHTLTLTPTHTHTHSHSCTHSLSYVQ